MAIERLRLDGQVAIVSGAGRGVGRGIANVLAEAGATVVGIARTAGQISETISEIEDAGGKGMAVTGDVMRDADVDRIIDTVMQQFGRIDILVNNSGGTTGIKPFLSITAEEFRYHFDWNATSAFLMSQAAARHIIAAGSGSIVNISSGSGHMGVRGLAHYCAAKGALNNLTLAMAQELAPKVRVNCIALGTISSPLLEETMHTQPGSLQRMRELIPLHREGDADDVGLAILYLCSSGCYVTSAILRLDGGVQGAILPCDIPDL